MKRSIVSVPVQRAGSQATGKTTSDQDMLAVEEHLQIRLEDRLAITMGTRGNDEELAVTPGENSITVTLVGEPSIDLSAQTRRFYLNIQLWRVRKGIGECAGRRRLHCPAPRSAANQRRNDPPVQHLFRRG